jgi:hypothetical protein
MENSLYFVKKKLTMRLFLALSFILFINKIMYSQDKKDILLQYSGESVTIRKMGKNHLMWYSEKNYSMITNDEDYQLFPDSNYYIVKPIVTVFEETDNQSFKPDIYVRIDYYYKKKQDGEVLKKEAETFSNLSYNVRPPAKVEEVKEATANKLHFTVKYRSNDCDFILEKDGGKESTIYFVYTDAKYPFLSYALMISDLKPIIIKGQKIN